MTENRPIPAPPDPLVSAVDPLHWRGARRWLLWGGCAWFALWTAGWGALDGLRPAPIPRLLGQEADQRKQLQRQASWRDGTRMALADSTLRLRSNLRHWLLPWYAGALLVHLRECGPDLVTGTDNWLFLKSRLRSGPGPYKPIFGSVAAGVLATIDRRMASLGVDTLFIPVPRKGVIAEDYLPGGVDPWRGFDEDIFEELEARGIPHAPLLRSLGRLDPAEAWFPYDSHWSYLSQVQAAELVGQALGIDRPLERRTAKINPNSRDRSLRGNLTYTGLRDTSPASSYFLPRSQARSFDLNLPGKKRKWVPQQPPPPQTTVHFGTSFSNTGVMIPHLRNVLPTPMHNHARAGHSAIDTMGTKLLPMAQRLPRRVLLELPLYQLLPAQFKTDEPVRLQSGVLRGLLRLPAAALHPLKVQAGPSQARGILHVEPGRLITSGDGVAELEITLNASRAQRCTARGRWGPVLLDIAVTREVPQGRIPLLGSHSPSQFLRLRALPAGSGRLRLVTALDLEQAAYPEAGPVSARDGDDSSWIAEFPFDAPAETGRHGALWWLLRRKGAKRGSYRIHLIPAQDHGSEVALDPVTLGPFDPAKVATLLVSLRRPGRWAKIRVEGSGARPAPNSIPALVDLPKQQGKASEESDAAPKDR